MKQIILALSFFVTLTVNAENKTEHTIETSHGSVNFKETTYPDTKKISPIVGELTKEENAAMQRDASDAARFLTKYANTNSEAEYTLTLDIAFASWMASSSPDKETGDRVVRILGASYGAYCIRNLGMRWAWISDEHGRDIALVRDDPVTRSFPFSSIQYRIEDRKPDLFYALYKTLEHTIEQAKK